MIRLQIRQYIYRGKEGYLVCGNMNERKTSIFFKEKGQAKTFVQAMKEGKDSETTLKEIWGIGRKGLKSPEKVQGIK